VLQREGHLHHLQLRPAGQLRRHAPVLTGDDLLAVAAAADCRAAVTVVAATPASRAATILMSHSLLLTKNSRRIDGDATSVQNIFLLLSLFL
jgi:hypothetical protein